MFHPQVDKTQSVNRQYDHSHIHPPSQPPPPPPPPSPYLPRDHSNQYTATSLVQRPPNPTVTCNRTCGRLIFILAFTIIIALSVVFMIYFVLVDSHILVFHVRRLEMSGLKMDSSTDIQWNTYVSARNPNVHLNFLIENANINLLYKNKALANAYHDQFQLMSEESKDIQADFKVANLSSEDDLVHDMMYEIANNMVLQFDLAMSIQATFRYEIINKDVTRYEMEVVCKDLELQFPPNYTTMGGGGGVIRSDDRMSKICSLELMKHSIEWGIQ
ncbi:uncharacterized protein LOC112520988 [Cynara cardunculus var. scolymus]|uniref:uncharacterized protein LOC112520988 n=1 Tax=Cynara cardunculus var. scolymus TaxID=59895 RepID=UPI000D626B3E|nr:uncharacterized protein LOC112520988 [Cynara cardunculus var. scolymus]